MYAEERQQVILERARVKGRVDVAALAEEFDVTTETIRRDLTVLERHGVLRRVHGGAIPVERLGVWARAVGPRDGDDRREDPHRQGGTGRTTGIRHDPARRGLDDRPAGRRPAG